MKSEKEILIAIAEKVLGVAPEQVPTLLYKKGADGTLSTEIDEQAFENLANVDKARIATIKASIDTTSFFDNGYKKAQSEVLTAKEKAFKEKYKIEGDYKLDELVEVIVSQKVKEANGGDIEETKVKSHPLFIQTLKKVEDTENAWKQKYDTDISNFKTQMEQTEVKGKARSLVTKSFLAWNPVLSEDKKKADNQVANFVDSILERYKLKEVDKVGIAILNEKGEVDTDEHGHIITLDKLVHSRASSLYDQIKQSKKGSGGNGKGEDVDDVDKRPKSGDYTMPETQEEFNALMFNALIPASEKAKIRQHWLAKQKG